MTTNLCEFELKVLRVCADQNVPDMQWGAAMSEALEFLSHEGLVVAGLAGVYQATAKGRELLQQIDAKVS